MMKKGLVLGVGAVGGGAGYFTWQVEERRRATQEAVERRQMVGSIDDLVSGCLLLSEATRADPHGDADCQISSTRVT